MMVALWHMGIPRDDRFFCCGAAIARKVQLSPRKGVRPMSPSRSYYLWTLVSYYRSFLLLYSQNWPVTVRYNFQIVLNFTRVYVRVILSSTTPRPVSYSTHTLQY